LIGCSGYRYEVIENSNEYLLKGEFYNNNPFVEIKPILPNSYLIKKNTNNIATREDIKSTDLRREKIVGGYIVDRDVEIEIRLLVLDQQTGTIKAASENGVVKVENRKETEDVRSYIKDNEKWIFENMNP
jgi:hypothetical protein